MQRIQYIFLRQERTQCWDPLEPLHSLVAIPCFRQWLKLVVEPQLAASSSLCSVRPSCPSVPLCAQGHWTDPTWELLLLQAVRHCWMGQPRECPSLHPLRLTWHKGSARRAASFPQLLVSHWTGSCLLWVFPWTNLFIQENKSFCGLKTHHNVGLVLNIEL